MASSSRMTHERVAALIVEALMAIDAIESGGRPTIEDFFTNVSLAGHADAHFEQALTEIDTRFCLLVGYCSLNLCAAKKAKIGNNAFGRMTYQVLSEFVLYIDNNWQQCSRELGLVGYDVIRNTKSCLCHELANLTTCTIANFLSKYSPFCVCDPYDSTTMY